MSHVPDPNEDPAITGVPEETPRDVRPSATGLVAGPIEGETDIDVAEVHASSGEGTVDTASMDQILQDAEGGVEGSTLDAPDD